MKKLSLFLGLAAVVGLAACDNASVDGPGINSNAYTDPGEAISDQGVTPRFIEGNLSGNGGEVCQLPDVNLDGEEWLGIKVDPPIAGTFGGFQFTISDDGKYLAWESLSGNIMEAVVVKGGPDTFIYDYNPPVHSSDSGLRSPDNNGGEVPMISHYVFCYTAGTASQGCSHGYFKTHTDSWAPTGFAPAQTVGSVFSGAGTYATNTLLEAMNFQGGSGVDGGRRILLMQAVAALLNAAHPDVDFPLTTAEVIAQVNAALATNQRAPMIALASVLDGYNNFGCPLN